jgi:DNA-directed RNA polymerase subunit RPC12/RpoP
MEMYYCAHCKRKIPNEKVGITKGTNTPRCPYCNRFLPGRRLSKKVVRKAAVDTREAVQNIQNFLKKMRFFQYSIKDLAKFTKLPTKDVNNAISDLLKKDLLAMEIRKGEKYFRWK